MLIRVYAPPYCNHEFISKEGYVFLEEGASLGDLFKKIGMPLTARVLPITSVNYERAGRKRILEDGDVVSIFQALAGG